MTKYERDPELMNFLSKVEDLDSKRYNNASTSKPTGQLLPPLSNDAPRHRNIRKADVMADQIVENRDNLAYRSAYNYEMTFSPKKTHYSLNELDLERTTTESASKGSSSQNAKKFVISEEDYLLLQKLKASQSPNEVSSDQISLSSEKGHRMPSRGRPREKERVSFQYDFNIQEKAPSTSSPSPPPPLPTRRSHVRTIEDDSEEKSVLPRRHTNVGVTERPIPLPNKPEVAVPEGVKPSPPVSRSMKQTSFLSSLEDNKLSMAKGHNSEVHTPKKAAKNSRIDYLDSIQLKPTTLSPTIKDKPRPNPPSPPAKRLPRSESFIKSALNSNLTTTSKPSLPEKPQKLRNANLTAQKAKPSIPPKKVELSLVLPELRPVETLSARQKFEDSIDLPKLRSSTRSIKKQDEHNIPEAIQGIQNLKKTKQGKPLIPQKKSFLTSSLNPTAAEHNGDANKLNNELEALSLRNSLKKRPPKAPERKLSMPEALRKIELMKKSKTEPVLESTKELGINAKLDAIIKSRNLRPCTTVSEFNSIKTNAATSSDSSISEGDTAKETKPLIHLNKKRARGPRRKPPTHV